ncbi:MAG: fibronectin type III domain-containing protein, partial [Sphingobacteriia bacterium]|nr:fibronectin type III domain-containing protein [Sphingobacteriia bacterium]
TPGATFGVDISRYEYSIDNGKTWAKVPGGDVKSPLTIGGLTNGTTYTVQLRPVNSVGSGAVSGAVTGKPREPLLADSRGTDVPIVKDPALTFALNSDIAVRGNKVAVALVAPTSAKNKVSYYMFTLKPKTKGAAINKPSRRSRIRPVHFNILINRLFLGLSDFIVLQDYHVKIRSFS